MEENARKIVEAAKESVQAAERREPESPTRSVLAKTAQKVSQKHAKNTR